MCLYGIWCTFSLQQWSRLPLMKLIIPLVFHQEALQRVFNGVMASLVFTNVVFCISESKKPAYDITETHCGRPNNSLTSPRLLSTWLQAESGSTCVCTWVWTSGLSASTSKIRMMMRKVARTKGIYHLLYLVCLSKPRKGLFKGCLKFGMSLFSRFSGCFSALAFPLTCFYGYGNTSVATGLRSVRH